VLPKLQKPCEASSLKEALMRRIALRATAIALYLSVATPAAPQNTSVLDASPLLDAIGLWLAANYDLPVADVVPLLVTAPAADLVSMRYGPEAMVSPGEVEALYDDTSGTIYLSEGWTGSSPAELSVLVHEMVHHLQSTSDQRFACPGERELVAYRAQDAWLVLFGETLESAFEIDAATLLVGTTCTH
jgi:hypothetical protein